MAIPHGPEEWRVSLREILDELAQEVAWFARGDGVVTHVADDGNTDDYYASYQLVADLGVLTDEYTYDDSRGPFAHVVGEFEAA